MTNPINVAEEELPDHLKNLPEFGWPYLGGVGRIYTSQEKWILAVLDDMQTDALNEIAAVQANFSPHPMCRDADSQHLQLAYSRSTLIWQIFRMIEGKFEDEEEKTP